MGSAGGYVFVSPQDASPASPSDTGKRGTLVWTGATCGQVRYIPPPSVGASIKAPSGSMVVAAPLLPPHLLLRSAILLHSSTVLSFIYPRYPALSTRSHSFPHPTMVAATRPKNKLAHPATPVMTEAAKQKAGIKTKRRPKKVSRIDTIRELEARLAAIENPHQEAPSKEPLVRSNLVLTCKVRH